MKDALHQRIETRQARIGVIGLGYVGLPLVRAFHGAGFSVCGFDIDPAKVTALAAGESYLRHIPSSDIQTMAESGRMEVTTDFSKIQDLDAIIICVPTPLGASREPDLGFIENTGRTIAPHLRRGQFIALESTTYPGTSRDVLAPILANSGLKPRR